MLFLNLKSTKLMLNRYIEIVPLLFLIAFKNQLNIQLLY